MSGERRGGEGTGLQQSGSASFSLSLPHPPFPSRPAFVKYIDDCFRETNALTEVMQLVLLSTTP